jgi:hypothetical protein
MIPRESLLQHSYSLVLVGPRLGLLLVVVTTVMESLVLQLLYQRPWLCAEERQSESTSVAAAFARGRVAATGNCQLACCSQANRLIRIRIRIRIIHSYPYSYWEDRYTYTNEGAIR